MKKMREHSCCGDCPALRWNYIGYAFECGEGMDTPIFTEEIGEIHEFCPLEDAE